MWQYDIAKLNICDDFIWNKSVPAIQMNLMNWFLNSEEKWGSRPVSESEGAKTSLF